MKFPSHIEPSLYTISEREKVDSVSTSRGSKFSQEKKKFHRYFISHPAGCPRRAFCACGAAVEIFGRPVRSLWSAKAWFKFPSSTPAARMAAVRNHHVFILKSHVEGQNWLVIDFNSGGHKSRVHVRSIAGYRIVDPQGHKMAGL